MVRTRRLSRFRCVAQLSRTKEAEAQHRYDEQAAPMVDSERTPMWGQERPHIGVLSEELPKRS